MLPRSPQGCFARNNNPTFLSHPSQDEPVADQGLEKLLTSVRAVKALRIAAIVQDLADCVIAVNDIRGG